MLFSFIEITSGENQGEKRQIYKDARGFPFFWQGKKQPRRQYLTDWYDEHGMKRSANASIRAMKQYKEICAGLEPTQRFPPESDVSLAEFIHEELDDVSSQSDITSEVKSENVVFDEHA